MKFALRMVLLNLKQVDTAIEARHQVAIKYQGSFTDY